MTRNIHLIVYCLLSTVICHGQDIHLSHLHASPLVVNPAMTGLYTGDVRLIANTKSQWMSLTNGYKTVVASADAKLWKIGRNDVIGGGVQFFSDVAGDLEFTTRSTSAYLSILKSLDKQGRQFISVGLQNTLITHSVDFSKVKSFDLEPTLVEGSNNQRSFYDLSLGIGWFYGWNRDNSFHVGLSAFHLGQPGVRFYNRGRIDEGIDLYRKFNIHGGGDFKLSRNHYLKPSFIITNQGPHQEMLMGTFWKYKTFKSHSNQPGAAIYLGGWMRWHLNQASSGTDAFVAAIRLDYKQLYMTFSFDVNISTLTEVSYGRGGPELSIVKILNLKRGNKRSTKVRCPDF